MGREIRRVPPGWEHPKMKNGDYQPVRDEEYGDALLDWDSRRPNPDNGDALLEWSESKPDPKYYRQQRWTSEEATAYQVYETITEGTPVSPVCPTINDLIKYLVEDGRGMGIGGSCLQMTEEEARYWIQSGGLVHE